MRLLCLTLLVIQAYLASGETNAQKQHDINSLLYKPTEPIPKKFASLKEKANNFHPVEDTSIYQDDGLAAKKLFRELESNRILERHHYFCLFIEKHREEALMLFETLLNCNDYECFINNAAFYRERLNEGVFIYGLYVAVIHSKHAEHVVLPPLYEITPHMFTNSEIISKAYSAQMRQEGGVFRMNFTGSQRNPEQRVAYFGEDIGMNSHHVSWHMDFPFWWKDSYGHHLDRKGELFFWVHHQLTARFDSERLSNYLDIVDELYWNKPIREGFSPDTTYRYGGEFPARPDNVKFEDVDGVIKVRDMEIMENRIRDAIAHGYVNDHDGNVISIRNENGMEILGSIIESSLYSKNPEYYGALHNMAHIILGRQSDPHGKFNMPPGVMEHFETATRDPSFFRLHKYMDNIFKEMSQYVPPYTQEELEFPGIKLTKVSATPLKTYFQDFSFDLQMAVDSTEGKEVPLSAVVSRLNHKEFGIDIEVDNNGEERHGTFRVFLCPAYDANQIFFTFDNGRFHCIELDKFFKKLAPGINKIHRKSSESSVTVPDLLSYKALVEKADSALKSGEELDLSEYERSCGIPNRMLLPKGNKEGMGFWLSVFVSDASEDTDVEHPEEEDFGTSHSLCGVRGEKYPDKKPLGYPFDRRIPDDRVFMTLDSFEGDYVKIFHEGHE